LLCYWTFGGLLVNFCPNLKFKMPFPKRFPKNSIKKYITTNSTKIDNGNIYTDT
jgi:hypothetical protein